LIKECPKSLISVSFLGWVVARLVSEIHQGHWILLAIVHNIPVGVNYRGPHLEALNLIERLWSVTTRRRGLGRGLLTERAGPPPLGKLLVPGSKSMGWGATDILTVLGATLMSFTSHDLQERIGIGVRIW
jgi:hypothetical protein